MIDIEYRSWCYVYADLFNYASYVLRSSSSENCIVISLFILGPLLAKKNSKYFVSTSFHLSSYRTACYDGQSDF